LPTGTRLSAIGSDRCVHEDIENMTATLDVTDLHKQFSIGRPAIDGVSFAVPAGEIVVLLGPSGCGKTTTLRCVAGLEHPTSGEISIAGRVVSSPARGILVPPRLRDLGMVFQSYAVWPHMTVRQNVIYPLKHRRIARADAGRKVDEVLELVGLSEYADRPVVALSGGQMQRVALARSIVYRPQLLLLDEPLSNLDAKLRLRLRDDLRVILKQTGMTALYVTHDQAEAVVLGDRIGVMRDGKLLQMGTPDQIYNRPADLFVANFTGATNELAGTLVGRNGEFGVVDFGDGRRGEAALLHALSLGEKVRIALRPENIAIGKQEGVNIFPARVIDRRYQGTQTVYDIDLFGRRLEALELGTAARHQVGVETSISLPREGCWAYRDTGPSSHD
jgi:iron(III) transport system ATP-binding protein